MRLYVLNLLAANFQSQNTTEKSIANYQKVISLNNDAVAYNQREQLTAQTAIGSIYIVLEEYQEANSHLQKALSISITINGENDAKSALVIYHQAQLMLAQDKKEQAITLFKKALKLH